MRTRVQRSIIPRVLEGAMHLLLDLDPDSEPVRGQVGLADGKPRRFIGYADLIATLESIRADESTGSDTPRVEGRA
jgi:hypothetical protein